MEMKCSRRKNELAAIFPAVLVYKCGVHANAILHPNIAKISAKHQSFDLKQQSHEKPKKTEPPKQFRMQEKTNKQRHSGKLCN